MLQKRRTTAQLFTVECVLSVFDADELPTSADICVLRCASCVTRHKFDFDPELQKKLVTGETSELKAPASLRRVSGRVCVCQHAEPVTKPSFATAVKTMTSVSAHALGAVGGNLFITSPP